MGPEETPLSGAFVDSWGSPVFATDRDSVAVLEHAVEDLVALSGEPIALADAAAADPDLVLARVLQAYLALYSTAEAGFETAAKLVMGLDGWDLGAGERELLHVLAAQSWASGEWERAVNFLERALLHDPRDLLALKVAQDLYFFLGDKQGLRGVVERVLGAWPKICLAGVSCRGCMPSGWRRTAGTPKPKTGPAPRSGTMLGTSGRSMRWRTCLR